MTYLRPPLNSPAWIHAFWYPTCHYRPKIGQNHGFSYISSFGCVWLRFWLVQITNLRLPLNFPAWVYNFLFPTCHCWWKKPKPWFWLYLWFWFGLVWFWTCSTYSSEASLNSPLQVHAIWYSTYHCSQKNLPKPWFWLYVWFQLC